jgi:hypothetical protein
MKQLHSGYTCLTGDQAKSGTKSEETNFLSPNSRKEAIAALKTVEPCNDLILDKMFDSGSPERYNVKKLLICFWSIYWLKGNQPNTMK